MQIKIAPSLLAADWLRLGEEIESVQQAGCDLLHCDIMDAHFVQNLSMGTPIVEAVAKIARVPVDVHLMLDNPESYLDRFAQAGADIVGFHAEVTRDPRSLIRRIHDLGKLACISLNPGTSADRVLDVLDVANQVLVMSVHPGFGGQRFIAQVLQQVRRIRQAGPPSLDIEIDGGIGPDTARLAAEAGANVLVAGTSVFGVEDRCSAIAALRTAASGA